MLPCRNSDLILSLVSLMSGSSIPALKKSPMAATDYIKDRLKLDIIDREAVKHIDHLLHLSSSAVVASLVERLHKIAQAMRTWLICLLSDDDCASSIPGSSIDFSHFLCSYYYYKYIIITYLCNNIYSMWNWSEPGVFQFVKESGYEMLIAPAKESSESQAWLSSQFSGSPAEECGVPKCIRRKQSLLLPSFLLPSSFTRPISSSTPTMYNSIGRTFSTFWFEVEYCHCLPSIPANLSEDCECWMS